MADDDDTSAGLTPGPSGTAIRRRSSRSAGPPKDVPVHANEKTATAGDEVVEEPATVDLLKGAQAPGVEQTVDESDVALESEVPKATRNWRRIAALGAVAALVVALIAAGVILLIDRQSATERDAMRGRFDQTARQTVLNLTTIKPDTAKDDVARILAGASGEFKSEFDGRQDPFVGVVKEAGVTTVGKIIESGVESENGNTANVLVAARADVSTSDQSQGGPRDFRMRVTVTDDGGTMTASNVEFVP